MKHSAIVTSFASAALFVACDSNIIQDSSFDLWCDGQLCEWQSDEGSVRRVSTWHEKDFGVELVGTPARISQDILVEESQCLRFKIIANVEAEAEVALEFDFFGDGLVDHSVPIPGVRWQSQEHLVKMPAGPFWGLRIRVHKQGPGKAIFAELVADTVANCYGDPIELSERELGYACAENADCVSGICATVGFGSSSCGECETDLDCDPGQICGAADGPQGPSYRVCSLTGADELGARCQSDAECQSGICQDWSCSECRDDSGCTAPDLCGRAATDVAEPLGDTFSACIPPASRQNDEPCSRAEECESGVCCFMIVCAESC